MKITPVLVLNLLFAFVLISCKSIPENVDTVTLSGDRCIFFEEDFAFLESAPEKNMLADDAVVPLAPWKFVTAIPGQSRIDFARTKNGSIELWIRNSVKPEPSFTPDGRLIAFTDLDTDLEEKLLIYHTENNTIEEVPAAFDDVQSPTNRFSSSLEPTGIYLGNSGKIWKLTRNINDYPEIGIYDEEAQKFRLLTFSTNLPNGAIAFDKQRDVFWVFDPPMIYSIDPVSLKIKKHISFPSGFIGSEQEIAFSPNGNIFFTTVNGNQRWVQSSYDIFKFDPIANTVESIRNEVPQLYRYRIYFEPFRGIFLDHSENLWIGIQGWVTPAGKWYKVLHIPLVLRSGLEYSRGGPSIMLESSDNRLWIEFPNGMMWLDTKKDEWCWFTTYRSNIVEDSNDNLWMVANGMLYQYPASRNGH